MCETNSKDIVKREWIDAKPIDFPVRMKVCHTSPTIQELMQMPRTQAFLRAVWRGEYANVRYSKELIDLLAGSRPQTVW